MFVFLSNKKSQYIADGNILTFLEHGYEILCTRDGMYGLFRLYFHLLVDWKYVFIGFSFRNAKSMAKAGRITYTICQKSQELQNMPQEKMGMLDFWQPGYHSTRSTLDPIALRPHFSVSLPLDLFFSYTCCFKTDTAILATN